MVHVAQQEINKKNAEFFYRQWMQDFSFTLNAFFSINGRSEAKFLAEQRKSFDMNKCGAAAPETILSSIKELRGMLKKFKKVSFHKENVSISRWDRKYFLDSLGKIAGLDIYMTGYK